ncbi:MAG TPA: MFS transporter [Jiangellaceae bacterium]
MTGTEELRAGGESPAAPTPRRKTAILLLACAAVGIVSLDIAIVNIALPSIQSEFDVGRNVLQWVVVAYGLLIGGFLIVGGRMTDRLGRKRTFLCGLAILAGMSLVAGLAQTAEVLIAARAGQGLGAALVVPAALSLLAVTFEEGKERDRAIGAFGAVGGVAGSFGVVVGGLLTAGPGWRWSFFINVPAGAALIVIAALLLSADRERDRTTRLDLLGATSVTAGLLLAIYGLHHATGHGWLAGSTLGVIAGATLLLLLFALLEARSAAPLVPHAMWRNRTVVSANLAAFFAFAALLGFIFLGTLLMQQGMGYSPIEAGIAWLTTTVTVFIVAMIGGRVAGTVGVRRMLITGLGLVALGALLLTRISADADYLTGLVPAFILAGIGFGLCGPAVQLAALAGVAESDAGLAAGLVETMREIGGAAGVAVVTTALVAGTGLDGFHAAFTLIAALAVAGGVVTVFGLQRTTR